MRDEESGESVNLAPQKARNVKDEVMDESEGDNGLSNPEASLSLQVYLRDYPMEEIPERGNRNVTEQLGGGELQFDVNLNPSANRILGLDFLARLQHRTRGLRILRNIHGVDLRNESGDICPRRMIKREIQEEWLRASHQEEVAENENNVVFMEEEGVNAQGKVNTTGVRRTRRRLNSTKRTVFAWMIELRTMKSRERVHYMDHKSKHPSLGGDVVKSGILCDCCSKVVSISEFEVHSWNQQIYDPAMKVSNPLPNICLDSGRGLSLLQCMAESWEKETEPTSNFYNLVHPDDKEKSDDTCSLCGEKGILVSCHGCPSTFHLHCLGLQVLPPGVWHCMYCCCKFCGMNCPMPKNRFESCLLVEISSECSLCERRYHLSCLQASRLDDVHSNQLAFCGKGCEEIYGKLVRLLGVQNNMEDGFSWSFIYRSVVDRKALQMQCHLVECNAKLSLAFSVLSRSFMPFTEEGSGVNVLRSIVYSCGSNLPRLDCKWFFTAILEHGEEVTSMASIRIHGNQIAEMPFVATAPAHRKKGMFTRLLKQIESALSFLKIEILVLPAVREVRNTWVNSFGFEPIDLNTKNIIKDMHVMVFSGTELLQKKIPKLT